MGGGWEIIFCKHFFSIVIFLQTIFFHLFQCSFYLCSILLLPYFKTFSKNLINSAIATLYFVDIHSTDLFRFLAATDANKGSSGLFCDSTVPKAMALNSTEVLIPFDDVPTGHHTGTTRPVVPGVDAPISWKNVIIKWQGEWHSFDENPWRRHVLDINLALFYVVHVVHGLLKFGECYSFNKVLRKIPGIWSFAVGKNIDMERWDLIATIIPRISYF